MEPTQEQLKMRDRIREFLKTRTGEKFTTLGGLAAHFDLSLTEMLLAIGGIDPVIYNAIEKNKARVKEKMRQLWRMSDKPNLNVSAYRLEADDDELMRLAGDSPKTRGLERKDPLLEVLQPEKVWDDTE